MNRAKAKRAKLSKTKFHFNPPPRYKSASGYSYSNPSGVESRFRHIYQQSMPVITPRFFATMLT